MHETNLWDSSLENGLKKHDLKFLDTCPGPNAVFSCVPDVIPTASKSYLKLSSACQTIQRYHLFCFQIDRSILSLSNMPRPTYGKYKVLKILRI